MSDSDSVAADPLGLRALGQSAQILAKGTVDGASAFLGRICLPAAEEFGLLLRDTISGWRAGNARRIAEKAEALLHAASQASDPHAHPRLVGNIIEQGSWADNDEVQDMWAGLLASSCDVSGTDDSNLMFVDLLARLSVSQVHLLNHACTTARKEVASAGWITANRLMVSMDELLGVAGVTDPQRLDRELDHLRSLGLLEFMGGGFDSSSTTAGLTPSSLALHMFARCHGHRGNPAEFFGVSYVAPAPAEETAT